MFLCYNFKWIKFWHGLILMDFSLFHKIYQREYFKKWPSKQSFMLIMVDIICEKALMPCQLKKQWSIGSVWCFRKQLRLMFQLSLSIIASNTSTCVIAMKRQQLFQKLPAALASFSKISYYLPVLCLFFCCLALMVPSLSVSENWYDVHNL